MFHMYFPHFTVNKDIASMAERVNNECGGGLNDSSGYFQVMLALAQCYVNGNVNNTTVADLMAALQ